MNLIIHYLGCGQIYIHSKQNVVEFIVRKYSDVTDKIIAPPPFFDKYRIEGIKNLDYADFKRVVEIMKVKAHLTEDGLNEICLIKAGMNKNRKLKSDNGTPKISIIAPQTKIISLSLDPKSSNKKYYSTYTRLNLSCKDEHNTKNDKIKFDE